MIKSGPHGIMGVGMMIPGIFSGSGNIRGQACIATMPAFVIMKFLPPDHELVKKNK